MLKFTNDPTSVMYTVKLEIKMPDFFFMCGKQATTGKCRSFGISL